MKNDSITSATGNAVGFGSPELRLPDELRHLLSTHLKDLYAKYRQQQWGNRVGFGARPAVVAIDLARFWLDPAQQIGSRLDAVVEQVCRILHAARASGVPVFFTTYAYDPADPPGIHDRKVPWDLPSDPAEAAKLFELDPRLERRPTESVIRKRYASSFKGTNFHEMLASLGVDTLIVTGISTSHCVYATCRDAVDSYRVIVPREAVGERCELFHEVNLLDIDLDLGDVLPIDEVLAYLNGLPDFIRSRT